MAASGENKGQAASGGSGKSETEGRSVVDLLKQQHAQMTAAIGKSILDTKALAKQWADHVMIEERLLEPALREAGIEDDALAEFGARRDMVRVLFGWTMKVPAAAPLKTLLKQALTELMTAETRSETGLYGLGDTKQVDYAALGQQAESMSQQFDANADVDFQKLLEPDHFRSPGSRQRQDEETTMNDTMRDRDDVGRYRSSDDDRRGSSYGRERDERGRFMEEGRGYRSGDDDHRRHSSDDDRRYSSSRYDDNDRYDDRRGQGSSSGRGSYGRSDDDDRRSSGGGSGRGSYGRSGDDDRRGYRDDDNSRYSSSRYEEDDRRYSGEGRGWYGDSRGHSEAARRGWEHRDERYGRSDDDNGRYRSSRYDDDDDHRSGRNHGGWFGDSRGHSEAARRGWEDRR